MTAIVQNVTDLIGNTPLIKLQFPSEETSAEIFAKCEFLNPGQSIKDRAALSIIEDAERRGLIAPDGIIEVLL